MREQAVTTLLDALARRGAASAKAAAYAATATEARRRGESVSGCGSGGSQPRSVARMSGRTSTVPMPRTHSLRWCPYERSRAGRRLAPTRLPGSPAEDRAAVRGPCGENMCFWCRPGSCLARRWGTFREAMTRRTAPCRQGGEREGASWGCGQRALSEGPSAPLRAGLLPFRAPLPQAQPGQEPADGLGAAPHGAGGADRAHSLRGPRTGVFQPKVFRRRLSRAATTSRRGRIACSGR